MTHGGFRSRAVHYADWRLANAEQKHIFSFDARCVPKGTQPFLLFSGCPPDRAPLFGLRRESALQLRAPSCEPTTRTTPSRDGVAAHAPITPQATSRLRVMRGGSKSDALGSERTGRPDPHRESVRFHRENRGD